MKTITRLLLLCILILNSGKIFSQIKFTIHATSTSATTITVTGSGSATTNGNGTQWSTSNAVNQIFGTSSFNYVNSNLNFKTFSLTGDLQLTDGNTPVNFSAIVLDDDPGGGDYDDFALNVSTSTAMSANTVYTLTGSATFDISGSATFGDLIPGVYSGTFSGTQFGFSNFSTSDIIIEVLLGTPGPELTTIDASTVTKNSALLGGNISSDGGATITERGVVYSSTDTTPGIGETGVTKEIEGGTTTGTYSETISGLTKGTTYYYRAYGINANGTSYGEIKSFTTLKELPNITTTDASNVTSTTADVGGEVTSNGNSAITEKGVLYSTTNPSPRIGDTSGTTKVVEAASGTTISETITGLTTTNVYYYRAYATNSQGTGYGAVKRFTLNNGLHFLNSGSTRVTIADNPAFDFSSGFTAEAWIKADVLNTRNIFSQYSSSDRAFSLFLLSSGKFEYTANPSASGSSEQYFTTTNTAISTGTWHHVAITYDGTTMRAFVNGVAAGTESHTGTLYNSSEPIEIGSRNNAHFFDGTIDEVRFWNRALSVTEINNGMNAQVPNNATGLVAYYKMNQGVAEGDNSSITTLTDSGPNSLHGTLNNFTKTGTTSNFVAGANGVSGQTNFGHNRFTSTGNWSTTGNWSHGSAPNTKQNATITNGVTVTIDVDDLDLNDFTLESGATISIPKDKEITINGAFSTSGNLDLSSDGSDSGVLFLKGTSSGNITYKRGGLLANKWSIITTPVSGQKIKAFADAAGNDIRKNTGVTPNRYAIAYYDDSQSAGNKWVYYDVNMDADIEFEVGKSYAISRATDGELSFTGTLTTDNLFQTLTTNQWVAIGNPFTTYFPANKNSNSSFLNDNLSALDDTYQSIYMWDNSQNKYVAVTELDASNRSLTPGQGFFIKLKNGQTDIVFKEEKRSTKPSTGITNFSKTKTKNPTIQIFANDGTYKVNTSIKYFNNASTGFDKGLDIGNFNSEGLDIYSRITDLSSETNFTIQSLPNNNLESMVVPIGIKTANNSEITLSVSSENLPNNYNIFLEDKELNSFHRFDQSDSNYIISLAKKTTFNNRFYIHVTPQVLNIEDVKSDNLNVYLSAKRMLTINGLQSEKALVKVISILGKELVTKKTNTNQVELPTSLKSGIYIIKIESVKGSLTKKIILE
jgi:hypothetical protein